MFVDDLDRQVFKNLYESMVDFKHMLIKDKYEIVSSNEDIEMIEGVIEWADAYILAYQYYFFN